MKNNHFLTKKFPLGGLRKLYLYFLLYTASITVCAQVGGDIEGTNLSWKITDGTLIISGTGAMPDFTPRSLPWHSYRFSLTALVIEEGVTRIGANAFIEFNFTGSLTLPKGITSIGNGAFYGCKDFTGSLILPAELTSIDERAFYGCNGFTGILILPEELRSIGNNAFDACSGFTGDLVLPTGLTYIGAHAFSGCIGFNGRLILPEKITSISDGAFGGCSGFTGTLTLPEGLKSIGKQAFISCKGFTGNLTFPEGLESIGEGTFQYCRGFNGVLTFPKRLKSINNYTFFCCSGFTGTLTLPEDLKSIGYQAFVSCSGFTGSLILPTELKSIDTQAFAFCNGFTGSLTLSEGLESIGENAFYECSGFTGNLILPEGLKSINGGTFWGCNSFNGSLILPEGLESIGERAFADCQGLSEVINHATTPQTIDASVFQNVPITTITLHVPAETTPVYSEKEVWKDFGNMKAINPVSGFSLNMTKTTLDAGTTEIIVANVTPEDATIKYILWTTDNPNIATVANGVVTGISEGTTIITATTYDGHFTATCEVTVTANFVYTVTFFIVGGSGALTATVDGVTITSPATVEEGRSIVFTAVPNSNYCVKEWTLNGALVNGTNITYTLENLSESAAMMVEFDCIITGSEITDTSFARVYPNPTNGVLTLEFEAEGAYNLSLADMTGKVLFRETVVGQTARIDIRNYPVGVYLLTINDGKRQSASRVVKH